MEREERLREARAVCGLLADTQLKLRKLQDGMADERFHDADTDVDAALVGMEEFVERYERIAGRALSKEKDMEPTIIKVIAADIEALRGKVRTAWQQSCEKDEGARAEKLGALGRAVEKAHDALLDVLAPPNPSASDEPQ